VGIPWVEGCGGFRFIEWKKLVCGDSDSLTSFALSGLIYRKRPGIGRAGGNRTVCNHSFPFFDFCPSLDLRDGHECICREIIFIISSPLYVARNVSLQFELVRLYGCLQ
jgi:hypothetical protein